MIWQGSPANDGTIGALMYSTNDEAAASSGWTRPRPLSERDRAIAGIRIGDRYPIARDPLEEADGTVVRPGEPVNGAYPWLTLDGTELVFVAGDQRTATIVGRATGGTLRPIDGPINWCRDGSKDRQFYTSPGAVPGLWRDWRESRTLAAPPLPYTAARPVLPLFGGLSWDCSEVDFEDHEDGTTCSPSA